MSTKEQCKTYYQRNKEKLKERRRLYVKQNYEKVRNLDNIYKKKTYLYRRLKDNYGLTIDQYNSLLEIQKNSCFICETSFVKTPHVDHCHKTGKIRGLLCGNCNIGLGSFKDNPELLVQASKYLRRFIDGELQDSVQRVDSGRTSTLSSSGSSVG